MCIDKGNGEKIQFKAGILTRYLDALRDLPVSHGVGEIAMESTSVYWMPVWRVLESDFRLWVVNPHAIRQLPGRKSDVKDAEWIATCLRKELIRGSYVPDATVRQLRQYNRRLSDINRHSVYIQNKTDACLQHCNIRFSNYVSNVDTKSYRDIVTKIAGGKTTAGELIGCVHGRTVNRWGRDVILAALDGVVEQADMDMLAQLKEELDMLRRHKADCLMKMRDICREHYAEESGRLRTIPGVKEPSALQAIAEMGVDMKTFATAAMLVGLEAPQ